MSRYYQYLNNVDKDTIITADYWNAFVAEEQATDDLLVGSLYPWAITASTTASVPTSFMLAKNTSTSWVRYFEAAGVFKNANNPNATELINVRGPTYWYSAHRILIPGLYAWNIGWAENWSGSTVTDDQVYAIKIKKMHQSQLGNDPETFEVVGEYRSITTSWAYSSASNRYHEFSTSFGMGYPMRTYSGMHFFNAPPYGTDYEYVIFEMSSSIVTTASNIYYSRMIGPNITFMKVR